MRKRAQWRVYASDHYRSAHPRAGLRKRQRPGEPAAPNMETCACCGVEFEARRLAGRLRFCSKACKAAHRRAAGADNVDQACHQCGVIFTSNRYDQIRHCSQSCAAICQHAGGCPR
jgi:hypothetical protein